MANHRKPKLKHRNNRICNAYETVIEGVKVTLDSGEGGVGYKAVDSCTKGVGVRRGDKGV